MTRNIFPAHFLSKYRTRPDQVEAIFIPLNSGFLKLEYVEIEGSYVISLVSFVLENNDDSVAVGMRLEFNLSEHPSEFDEVTFISENGISGLQWSGGQVIRGGVELHKVHILV